MDLVFKEKQGGLSADSQTDSLFTFLNKYPQYIELTFSLLGRRHKTYKNIKKKLEISPEIDTVEEDRNLEVYYSIMNVFYDTTEEILNIRRGKLLELLVSKLKPINTDGEYNVILEALVEYQGSKVSNKDIDIVFEYCENNIIYGDSNNP